MSAQTTNSASSSAICGGDARSTDVIRVADSDGTSRSTADLQLNRALNSDESGQHEQELLLPK